MKPTRTDDHTPVYTVILPVYNERENLERLIGEISDVLSRMDRAFEIIGVDDCSTDGSADTLRAIAIRTPWVHVRCHMKNCGQSAAFASGLAAARGEVIITMDSDGQNDPADIPLLLNALVSGVDAACGIRQNRQDNRIRKLSSLLANRFRNWVTGDSIRDAGCTFRVIRKSALAEIPVFNGLHRFLPTLLRYQGYRVVEVPVHHRARTWGTSKYGIRNRFWRGLLDCFAMRWFKKRIIPGQRLRHD